MNRKSKQAAEREAKRLGARIIDWDHGQKHEIATVRLKGGDLIEAVFSRGPCDDVRTARFLRLRIEQAEARAGE